MRTTRVRSIAALVTCLGCGLFMATPTGAVAAPHNHAASSKKPVPKGFFVTGSGGQITHSQRPSALVRDGDNVQHVVTTVPSASQTDKASIDYLTLAPGAKKWTSHLVPGLRPAAGPIQVELHLSTDGRRVFAVFYECDGVFVADAAIHATRLLQPSAVETTTDTCSSPTTVSNDPPIADAIALPGHQVGVMLPDPAQADQPAIFTGVPGGTFTPGQALPTADGFTPVQLAMDPRNGRVVVVGEGNDGTNEDIYAVTASYYGADWSAPVNIASLDRPDADYTIEAVSAYNETIWVGLLRPAGAVAHPKHNLFVNHGTKSGGWVGVFPLPHSNALDTSLRLVTNPDTGHLHAAFTRVDPGSRAKRSGIMQEARLARWSTPTFYTHWYRDYTDQITFNSAGRAVLSYNQR